MARIKSQKREQGIKSANVFAGFALSLGQEYNLAQNNDSGFGLWGTKD
jgi:hypothetical protein